MIRPAGTLLGKSLQAVLRLKGNGGQALPGLVIEKVLPGYLTRMLAQLPEGVVVITGTNGKTTTTKMVVELLRSQGKRVLTNPTGSNLTRGIISSLAAQATPRGRLPYDMAVLELDEAYAKQFTRAVAPRWVLALNVSRDQLDRFGEVEAIARLIGETMRSATVGVVTNTNDSHLRIIGEEIAANSSASVTYFGVANSLREFFPTDSELVAVTAPSKQIISAEKDPPLVELSDFSGQDVTFTIAGKVYKAHLRLDGQHNFQNAAAAVSLAMCLLPEAEPGRLITELAKLTPAFGRGERYRLQNGSELQLALVKNPASFRQALASYLTPGLKIMIAINDNYADSRDMSWLWDVDFAPLKNYQVVLTTGRRAADMALRLRYDDIPVEHIEPDLERALRRFCSTPGDKLLLSSYTAMLWLHANLAKRAGKDL